MRHPSVGVPISLLVLGLLPFTVLGCADPAQDAKAGDASKPDRVLTVSEAAKAGDGVVAVRGYILIGRDGTARLCSGLAGSYPPQCGQPSLVVKGLKPDSMPGRDSAQGVVWFGEKTFHGTVKDDVPTLT
jgi:hypothetical protein